MRAPRFFATALVAAAFLPFAALAESAPSAGTVAAPAVVGAMAQASGSTAPAVTAKAGSGTPKAVATTHKAVPHKAKVATVHKARHVAAVPVSATAPAPAAK